MQRDSLERDERKKTKSQTDVLWKFRFTKRDDKWSTSESTDGERKKKRWRECVEWDVSMTRPSRKISTGKSIWEWVRLTLTPNVQPVMSWEESSWQRIRILETYIHRGSEKHSCAHLKTHTHTRRKPTHSSMQTDLIKCVYKWGIICTLIAMLCFNSVRHTRELWHTQASMQQPE